MAVLISIQNKIPKRLSVIAVDKNGARDTVVNLYIPENCASAPHETTAKVFLLIFL